MNETRSSLHDPQSHRGTGRWAAAVVISAAVLALGACDSRAQPPSPADLVIPEGAPSEAVSRAAGRLGAALLADNGELSVSYGVRQLGDGLYAVRAHQVGSYPGTGASAVVIDGEGRSFGVHGDHDLALLVQERGWIASPPPAELLLALMDNAYFEGMGSTSAAQPGLTASADGLTLAFDRFVPPGPSYPWRAFFPSAGETRLETATDGTSWVVVPTRRQP